MANVDVGVQLRLLDQLTSQVQAPIGAMNRLRQSISGAATEANRSTGAITRLAAAYERLSNRAERAHARMMSLRSRALGVAAGAFALGFPLYRAAEYEMGLTRFGQVAGWTGSDHRRRILEVNDALRQVSRLTATSTADLVGAAATIMGIVGSAFETNGVFDVNRMRTTMEAVARWSTAAGVSLDEAARATAVLFQNAGLSADALERAFNIVTQAGKIGGFEAADSARWFPGMLASYGTMFATHIRDRTAGMTDAQRAQFRDQLGLGMVANLSAFLQIARLGAADANIAGNNLVNVIQKMFIPETARNFRRVLGIDFQQHMFAAVRRGDDPIFEVIKLVAGLVQRHGGNTFMAGLTFADRQALEGLMPLVNHYLNNRTEFERILGEVRQAGDPSSRVVREDLATTMVATLTLFRMLRNEVANFWSEVLLAGGGASINTFFATLTGWLARLNELIAGNRGFASLIVGTGFTLMGVVASLVLLRFALAGVSLMFARAGMAAISFLRVIPGMGLLLSASGLLGGPLGILARLGLIGGAYLAYRNWDAIAGADIPSMLSGLLGDGAGATAYERWIQLSHVWEGLKAHVEPVIAALSGFFERLGVLFPSLYPSLVDFFAQFRLWTGDVGHVVDQLRRLGSDLFETLRFLFGAGGDPAAFERFRAGFGDLAGNLTQSVPALQRIGEWWSSYRSRLLFQDEEAGISGGLAAWGKGILAVFGAFSTWAVATHGANGFLLILMALRSAMFVIGTIVGSLQIIALILSTLIAPIIESLLDSPFIRRLLLGFGLGLGAVGLVWYQLGWEGVQALFGGFFAGFAEATRSARTRLSAAWNRMMVQLFGDDTGPEAMNRLFLKSMEWGMFIGSYASEGLNALADGINYLSETLDGFSERHPVLTSLAGGLLALVATVAVVGGAISILTRLGTALWTLSGIPAVVGFLRGGWNLGARMGPAVMSGLRGLFAAGGTMAALLAPTASGIGALMTMGPTLMGLGPIGWAVILAGVLALVLYNLDAIKAFFADANTWVNNSALFRLLNSMYGPQRPGSPGEDIPTLAGARPRQSWEESTSETLDRIRRRGFNIGTAGEEAATGIRDAGRNTASALNDAAAALAAAAARLAIISGSDTGPVQSNIDSALNDGARRPGTMTPPYE